MLQGHHSTPILVLDKSTQFTVEAKKNFLQLIVVPQNGPKKLRPNPLPKGKKEKYQGSQSTGRRQMDRSHHTANHTGRGSRVCYSLGSHSCNKPGSYYRPWYKVVLQMGNTQNRVLMACAIRRHIQQTKCYANLESWRQSPSAASLPRPFSTKTSSRLII